MNMELQAATYHKRNNPVQKSINGGHEFRNIYFQYRDWILQQVRLFASCRPWAEDITQEIYTKIWLNWERIETVENKTSYLSVLTRNTCMNFLIKNKRNVLGQYWLLTDTITPGIYDVEERVLAKELTLIWTKAIEGLPIRQKQVYWMLENGNNYFEVAVQLNISWFTVKQHRALALRSIANFMSYRKYLRHRKDARKELRA